MSRSKESRKFLLAGGLRRRYRDLIQARRLHAALVSNVSRHNAVSRELPFVFTAKGF